MIDWMRSTYLGTAQGSGRTLQTMNCFEMIVRWTKFVPILGFSISMTDRRRPKKAHVDSQTHTYDTLDERFRQPGKL